MEEAPPGALASRARESSRICSIGSLGICSARASKLATTSSFPAEGAAAGVAARAGARWAPEAVAGALGAGLRWSGSESNAGIAALITSMLLSLLPELV